MTHALKTWPPYYKAVEKGEKTFDVRKADRDFRVGNTLLLQEFDPVDMKYTGLETSKVISYILSGGDFGIEEGYVVLGLQDKSNYV